MVTIVVYIILLIALTPPLGAYMYRVYSRERIGRAEGIVYRLIGVNPTVEQSWRRYAVSCLWFSGLSMLLLYGIFRLQQHLPLNPVGARRRGPVRLVQHGVELHHEHQLAGLRRRDHDDVPQPDARADLPELRLGGGRDGGARRAVPRVRDVQARRGRQLLARPRPRHRLHPAPAVRDRGGPPGHAGRRPDARRQRDRSRASRGSSRRSPAARSPGRSRSSSSGRTAAGSST